MERKARGELVPFRIKYGPGGVNLDIRTYRIPRL